MIPEVSRKDTQEMGCPQPRAYQEGPIMETETMEPRMTNRPTKQKEYWEVLPKRGWHQFGSKQQ
jgi:hypothetical protein